VRPRSHVDPKPFQVVLIDYGDRRAANLDARIPPFLPPDKECIDNGTFFLLISCPVSVLRSAIAPFLTTLTVGNRPIPVRLAPNDHPMNCF